MNTTLYNPTQSVLTALAPLCVTVSTTIQLFRLFSSSENIIYYSVNCYVSLWIKYGLRKCAHHYSLFLLTLYKILFQYWDCRSLLESLLVFWSSLWLAIIKSYERLDCIMVLSFSPISTEPPVVLIWLPLTDKCQLRDEM